MAAIAHDATVSSTLLSLVCRCREELAALEPERFDSDVCATLAKELASLAKSCETAGLRAAARAAAGGAHRDLGYADGHDWVASMSGTTSSAARDALRTVAAADECPETRDALRAGHVSVAQASEIVRAERDVPGCEHELLETARGGSLGAVRDQSRTVRLESVDREQLRARQHHAREVRHWRDREGMTCGSFRLAPVAGAAFVNRLDREADRRFGAAKRDGRELTREQAGADALVSLAATGAGDDHTGGAGSAGATTTPGRARRRRPVRADVVIVQSAEVARRGHVHPGEVCHVVGGGPIAPSEVEELLAAGAFVKAVLHDGTQVTHVAHHGRYLNTEMRTALGIGRPPAFDGLACGEPGCERRLGLEIDHLDPVAHGGATSLENLDPKCFVHHQAKTRRDRSAGLLEQGP